MHRDTEKINMKVTETCTAFPAKQSINDDKRDKYDSLYKTNFKMDSDLRISTFNTTHGHYYKPKLVGQHSNTNLARIWMKSQFPQGDIAKADEPISNYRGSYQGHDGCKQPSQRVSKDDWTKRSALVGDNLRRFATTHGKNFIGSYVLPPKSVPKHTASSIPEGDKEKVTANCTTMRDAYQPNKIQYEKQDSSNAYKKLYETNYKMKDGQGRFDQYVSTQAESYHPISNKFAPKFKRDRDRNASDIPEGDTDEIRGFERINSTVARSHHKHINLSEASVPRVNGSQLRTVSNVQLGEKELSSHFYNTTCDTTYHAVSVPYERAPSHPKSSVPLKYFGDLESRSTTWSDFHAHNTSRLKPHKVGLENLRVTHFTPPLGNRRFFLTSHDSQYTPKAIERISVDPGRLQRSSVPIGTMGNFIEGCHNGWE
uniref:Uncharacterized protein C19orf45-like n=1 Tax=Phallusia mammillata TaxID=59560 RepID=A0A6F9D8I7_9ASCI|nr:uncharacterized protein C19orf45-like [Phallusia mammillata]